MALAFTDLCDLYQALESITSHQPPWPTSRRIAKCRDCFASWLRHHKISITDGPLDPSVLLSSLYPARRTDRVYALKSARLARMLKRCLSLGRARQDQLDHWLSDQNSSRKTQDLSLLPPSHTDSIGDLGLHVERILREAEFPKAPHHSQVTVHEVDCALDAIASNCRFSAPAVRSALSQCESEVDGAELASREQNVSVLLTGLFQRMQSREAKWLIRLILKDLSTTGLEYCRHAIFSCVHPRLSSTLQVYDDMSASIAALKAADTSSATAVGQVNTASQATCKLKPKVGIKIGPPQWIKAKGGIQNVLSSAAGRQMVVEQKFDGEYCQIHIDMSKGMQNCIQIFSKSGKDSTVDRSALHPLILKGMGIGSMNSMIRKCCIFEGEMLVWSDAEKKILDFHKIRKHVYRSGSKLGAKEDSQPHPYEHLMIMVHDLLLLDDQMMLHQPYHERHSQLKRLVTPTSGRIQLSPVIDQLDFLKPQEARHKFMHHIARAFALRWEGLVLKPTYEPYFRAYDEKNPQKYYGKWIKVKKDCIHGVGDTADFAVVGAAYQYQRAMEIGNLGLSWTHFFIACCVNRAAVLDAAERPKFMVIDCVTDCIKDLDFEILTRKGQLIASSPQAINNPFDLDQTMALDPKYPKMSVVFREPFVFDIAGSGFEKSADRKAFTLRFPRVVKVHWDRSWRDAIDLAELENLADQARAVPIAENLESEVADWYSKIQHDQQSWNTSLESTRGSYYSQPTQLENSSTKHHVMSKLRHSGGVFPSQDKPNDVLDLKISLAPKKPSGPSPVLIRVDSAEKQRDLEPQKPIQDQDSTSWMQHVDLSHNLCERGQDRLRDQRHQLQVAKNHVELTSGARLAACVDGHKNRRKRPFDNIHDWHSSEDENVIGRVQSSQDIRPLMSPDTAARQPLREVTNFKDRHGTPSTEARKSRSRPLTPQSSAVSRIRKLNDNSLNVSHRESSASPHLPRNRNISETGHGPRHTSISKTPCAAMHHEISPPQIRRRMTGDNDDDRGTRCKIQALSSIIKEPSSASLPAVDCIGKTAESSVLPLQVPNGLVPKGGGPGTIKANIEACLGSRPDSSRDCSSGNLASRIDLDLKNQKQTTADLIDLVNCNVDPREQTTEIHDKDQIRASDGDRSPFVRITWEALDPKSSYRLVRLKWSNGRHDTCHVRGGELLECIPDEHIP